MSRYIFSVIRWHYVQFSPVIRANNLLIQTQSSPLVLRSESASQTLIWREGFMIKCIYGPTVLKAWATDYSLVAMPTSRYSLRYIPRYSLLTPRPSPTANPVIRGSLASVCGQPEWLHKLLACWQIFYVVTRGVKIHPRLTTDLL